MEKLKRYLVFAFNRYYPNGGMGDLEFTTDEKLSNEDLKAFILSDKYKGDDEGTVEVFDLQLGETVTSICFDSGEFVIYTDDDNYFVI